MNIFGHGSKTWKVSLTLLFGRENFFVAEFRTYSGEIQQLGEFGAKISKSVKQKCQANLNHAHI